MVQADEAAGSDELATTVTLFTDAYVIRGTIQSGKREITDILNAAEEDFIVLSDVVLDEYGSRSMPVRTRHAQVNLSAALFAVVESPVDAERESPTATAAEQTMISIPPFRIIGGIQLPPDRDMRDALVKVTGRFVPMTDATYWSEAVGEARRTSPMVAFNHARAQILAPHREVDPWEGLGSSAGHAALDRAPDAIGDVPAGIPSTSTPTGTQDPWGAGAGGTSAAAGTAAASDPWRDAPGGAPGATGDAPSPGNPWGGPGGNPWAAGRPRRDEEPSG